MALTTVAAVVGIAGGLNSLSNSGGSSGGSSQQAQTASQLADPAQGYRPGWAGQLNTLLTNPGSVASSPLLQDMQGFSNQQVERGMAATGQTQSGAEQTALQSQASSNYMSYYNSMVQNLMNLTGTPAGGATGYLQGSQQAQNTQNQGLSNIMGGLGGLSQIYGNTTTNNNNGNLGYGYTQVASGYDTQSNYSGAGSDYIGQL
jgi:regulatory protein YycI of two-component signal transduction system YycFG